MRSDVFISYYYQYLDKNLLFHSEGKPYILYKLLKMKNVDLEKQLKEGEIEQERFKMP